METLALCADVLVLKDIAGSMGKTRTTHAFEVDRTFYCSIYLGAFHICVGRFGECGVGIPVKIVSLALDLGIEGSEVGHNHIVGKLAPVRRFPCCEGIGIPDECCFCVVNCQSSHLST